MSDPQDGDADAVSGLSSAKYSISNSKADVSSEKISISEGKGDVNIEIPESKTTKGTAIRIDLADNANNTYSNTYTYYIDNTPPKADLSVSGKDPSSHNYLKKDPVITYSGSDALSGLADIDGIVFKINGTEYKNVSGKKLSAIAGRISDTTKYKIELIVTDKAGNRTIRETVFMVDKSKSKVSGTLLAKMTAKDSKGLTLTWTKVKGAQGYDIFFIKCGKQAPKKVRTIKGNKTFKWTKKNLKKNTAYKAVVKAYVMKDGKKSYVRTCPMVHAYTSGGKKNYTNSTVKKSSVVLKKGKTYKIKATVNKLKKGKRLMPTSHAAKLRYKSSDAKVATVSKNGKIKAKGKGTCYVYVYAVNGAYKKVKVTVN